MDTLRRTLLQRFAAIAFATTALVAGSPSARLLRAAEIPGHDEEPVDSPSNAEIDDAGFQSPCDCGDTGDGGDWTGDQGGDYIGT